MDNWTSERLCAIAQEHHRNITGTSQEHYFIVKTWEISLGSTKCIHFSYVVALKTSINILRWENSKFLIAGAAIAESTVNENDQI